MTNWLKKQDTLGDDQTAPGERSDGSASLMARGWKAMTEGDIAEAKRYLNRAVLIDPCNQSAFYLLGKVAKEQGDLHGAIENFCEALDIQPDFEIVFNELAQAYLDAGEEKNAERTLLAGIACFPQSAQLHAELGNLYAKQQEPDKAIASFRQSLSIDPGRVETHNNLGIALHEHGHFEAAVWHHRRAVELNPDYVEIHSNLMLILSFDTRPSNPKWQYLAEALKFGNQATAKARPFTSWHVDRDQQSSKIDRSRLRVGLVSGDLRIHAVGFFLEGVLRSLNLAKLELLAYSMNPCDDVLTKRIRPYFAQWTSIVGISDETAARQIHEDGVDILIDLAGHSPHNRLPMFAWSPAPVQASWIGYLASTGLPEIGYVLADPVSAPDTVGEQFVEKIWRMPETFFCFTPPIESLKLAITSLPAVRRGFITFGSFQRVKKVNDDVLCLWGRILQSMPTSRLCLRNSLLDIDSVRVCMLQRLMAAGITADRVTLEPGVTDREDYLATYADIDIVLDTFPYPGATTTCEALWMGVPTVTLAGETMLGRIGASLLTCAGLEGWVANSEEEYVELAVKHGTDIKGLTRLRARLREQVRETPLFDAKRFAPQLEETLFGMWRHGMKRIEQLAGDKTNNDAASQPGESVNMTPERLGAHAVHRGNLVEAANHYRDAVKAEPDNSDIRVALAFVLVEQNLHAEAKPHLERALRVSAENADARYLLGKIAHAGNDLPQAIDHLNHALELRPGFEVALRDLSHALFEDGQKEKAKEKILQGITLFPASADFHFYKGNMYAAEKAYQQAVGAYQDAVLLQPDYAQVHYNLGRTLIEARCAEQALVSLDRALELESDYVEAHNSRGTALMALKKYDEALESYRTALQFKPDDTDAWHNIGCIYFERGDVGLSVESFRRALAVKPNYFEAHSNLLLAQSMQLPGPVSISEYFVEARLFGKKTDKLARPYVNWQSSGEKKRNFLEKKKEDISALRLNRPRLKIGFVSGDLRMHAVVFFLESVLSNLNPEKFELFAYSMNPQNDAVTERIRSRFTKWTPITAMTDEDVARTIYKDEIDILIDLAGHSPYNRLPVFAWKPAPVQVSWLGYLASTGVTGMDYILADPVSVPKENHGQFTEDVWYLPDSLFCFMPPEDNAKLAVAPLPALRNGHIVFGSFQRINKLSDATLMLWGRVLKAMPEARLVLCNSFMSVESAREKMLSRLMAAGIARERVSLLPGKPNREDHLAIYADVDIVLDTFPYPGATTTCEALWMGVPTVTLAGQTMLGRIGASLMTCAKLQEWVAQSEEEYVARSVQHAGDIVSLGRLRAGLREQVRETSLFDAVRFAPQLEEALFGMWLRHVDPIS